MLTRQSKSIQLATVNLAVLAEKDTVSNFSEAIDNVFPRIHTVLDRREENLEEVKTERLLSQSNIKQALPGWTAHIVFDPKKDRTFRFYTYLRQSNAVAKLYWYMVFLVDDCINGLSKLERFSTLAQIVDTGE